MSDPYTSHSTGKLKLKGVKDSKISKSKSKKKSSSKPKDDETVGEHSHQDNSVVLKHLEEEDAQIAKDRDQSQERTVTGPQRGGPAGKDAEGRLDEGEQEVRKTEAERRWDEQRRKRLEERLRREGVKTHKERVEELNRYLSGLSEHHDMPKIGPG
jgi:protein FAM32A